MQSSGLMTDLRATVFAAAVVAALAFVGDHSAAIDPYSPDWDGENWADIRELLDRDGADAESVAALRAHYQAALYLITHGLTGADLVANLRG